MMMRYGSLKNIVIAVLLLALLKAQRQQRPSAPRARATKLSKSSRRMAEHRKAFSHTGHLHGVIRPKEQREKVLSSARLINRKKHSSPKPTHIRKPTSRILENGGLQNSTEGTLSPKAGRIRGLDDLALRFRVWDEGERYSRTNESPRSVVVARKSRLLSESIQGESKPTDELGSKDRPNPAGPTTLSSNNLQYSILLAGEQFARNRSLRLTTIKPNATTFSPYEINPSPIPDY